MFYSTLGQHAIIIIHPKKSVPGRNKFEINIFYSRIFFFNNPLMTYCVRVTAALSKINWIVSTRLRRRNIRLRTYICKRADNVHIYNFCIQAIFYRIRTILRRLRKKPTKLPHGRLFINYYNTLQYDTIRVFGIMFAL